MIIRSLGATEGNCVALQGQTGRSKVKPDIMLHSRQRAARPRKTTATIAHMVSCVLELQSTAEVTKIKADKELWSESDKYYRALLSCEEQDFLKADLSV